MKITIGGRTWRPAKFLTNLFTLLGLLMIAWCLVSYIDIIAHNMNGGPRWENNIVTVLLQYFRVM